MIQIDHIISYHTFSLGSFSQRITVGQSSTELTTAPGGVNVAGLDDVIAIASAVDFQLQFSMEFKVKLIVFVYQPREEIRKNKKLRLP